MYYIGIHEVCVSRRGGEGTLHGETVRRRRWESVADRSLGCVSGAAMSVEQHEDACRQGRSRPNQTAPWARTRAESGARSDIGRRGHVYGASGSRARGK